MGLMHGEVISFDSHKGYGWIGVDGEADVFVHANDLACDKADIRPGVLVDFSLVAGPKGERAAEVRPQGTEPLAREEAERPAPSGARSGDDDLEVEVLRPAELRVELTERLLAVDPPLLATQLLAVRQAVDVIARRYGWVAD